MNRLENLKAKEAAHLADLKDIRADIKAEQLSIAKEEFGVYIGVDVVRFGQPYIVTEIDVSMSGKPLVTGRHKTSGESRKLYADWDIEASQGD